MSIVVCYCSIDGAALDRLVADPLGIEETNRSAPPSAQIDVDKDWEAIHFVLTGDIVKGEGVLASVIHGGTPFGPDHGYGPVRYLTADAVKAIAEALEALTAEDLKRGYQPELMDEVYPEGSWSDPDSDFDFETLLTQMDKLQAFYTRAATNNECVLVWAG